MITTGWIKVYREIENHWISKDLRRLGWWIYLLYKASYEDNKVLVGSRLIELKRGQLIISLSALEKRFEASRPTVLKFLELLEQEKMVTRCVYQKVTILTICNYDDYQGVGQKEVTNMETNSLPVALPMRYPTKEDKEEKNINNTNSAHAREGNIPWVADTEKGYASTFIGQGSAIPFAKRVGKTPQEVVKLLDVYMAERELKNKGHKDYNEFVNLFLWHVNNKKISIPMEEQKPKEKKVISGKEIFEVYG